MVERMRLPGTYRSVSAGWTHTCAVGETGTITCWGDGWAGQTDEPVGALQLRECGNGPHLCGARVRGEVVCWGAEEAT